MKLNSIITALLILSASLQVCFAQEESRAGCKLINKDLHAVSIKYAKSDAPKGQNKSDSAVFLRLYNNTDCPIYIQTESFVFTEAVQGRTTDIVDGEVVKIGFLIQEKEQEKESKDFYKWSDSQKYSRLLGGRHIFFTVPLEVFRNKFFVIVPFFYEWDFPDDVNSVKHQAYFYYGDIPSSVLGYMK